MAAPVRTAAGRPLASMATPPATEPSAMPTLTAEAGSDAASGAAGAGQADDPVLHRRAPCPSRTGRCRRRRAAASTALPPKRPRASSDAVTPSVPTTRVRGGVGVGEAAARRTSRASSRPRRSGGSALTAPPETPVTWCEERHEVGQRGLDRDEDQQAEPRARQGPAVRRRGGPGPTARPRASVGTDGSVAIATTRTPSADGDDGGERAPPADGVAQQGAQRQPDGAGRGEPGDDHRHRPAAAVRRHDRGRRRPWPPR